MSVWQQIQSIFRGSPARDRPDNFLVIKDWPVDEHFGWTEQQVQSAIRAQGDGYLQQPEALLHAMERDPIYAHGLRVRTQAQVAVPMRLDWSRSAPEGAQGWLKKHAENLQAHLPDLWAGGSGPNAQATISKYRTALGVAPAAVTWGLSQDGLTWLPTIHALEAGWLSYREDRSRYMFQARDGQYEVVPDGKKWLLFCEMSSSYPHMEGNTRAAAAFWWMKHAVARYWFQYAKTHGNAQRKVKVPGKQRENEDVKKLVEKARAMVGGEVVTLPQYGDSQPSFDFELIEAKAATWETFPEFIALVDKYITLLWLGATDNTQGADDGSRARAQVHERVSLRYLSADCMVTAATLRVLLRQWARYNRLSPSQAPDPIFNWQPPGDIAAESLAQQRKALGLQQAGNGLEVLSKLGIAYDAEHVLAQFGIELFPKKIL